MRFSDEELKHQALFRRIDAMIGEVLPAGYRFDFDPERRRPRRARQEHLGGAGADAATSSCSPSLTTARASIPTAQLSELFKDVFLYHWKEESQHAILDELEWVRHDAGADGGGARPGGRRVHRAGRRGRRHPAGAGHRRCRLLRGQLRPRRRAPTRRGRSRPGFSRPTAGNTSTRAPRHPHFGKVLSGLITEDQSRRIQAALATLH